MDKDEALGWIAKREARKQDKLVEETFSEAFGHPTHQQIKRWSDKELHAWLVGNDLHPEERSLAERELDRRKAWEAPAGKAFWIACAALGTSIIALAVSLLQN